MFGRLRATNADLTVEHFRTEKTAGLLAYLAFYADCVHTRDELMEVFWPGVDPLRGSMSLRTALASLRRQLEPPGTPVGSVILADTSTIGMSTRSFTTDVTEFEAELAASAKADNLTGGGECLRRAVELYASPLLPGSYEEWVAPERERLAEACMSAVRQLIRHLVHTKELSSAIDYAIRAVQMDPIREESHRDLMQLYLSVGQPSVALRQYKELEGILKKDGGGRPTAATQQIAHEIEIRLGKSRPPLAAEPRAALPPTSGLQTRASIKVDSRPTGTVTFLCADLEGSGVRNDGAVGRFRREHDFCRAIIRTEAVRYGGYEVKVIGGSVLIAFASAADALACAIAGQRAMGSVEWPGDLSRLNIRMALQTGDVEIEKGRYGGPVLKRAGRLLSASHSGQILCSETTAEVLRRDLEPGVQLLDLGIYLLRDQQVPERLFQITYPEMPRSHFPAPKAVAAHAGQIPMQYTRLFGRAAEIERLVEFLAPGASADTDHSPRLYSLTGPGGTGKTRLSIEVANRLLGAYNGAVWFVPLADISDAHLIGEAMAEAMRLSRSAGVEPFDLAVEALSQQPSLLVLDNFEHMVVDGAPVLQALLQRVPGVRCLVTTRKLLGLAAERAFPVSSLETPAAADTPDRLGRFESVRLFVDRAQIARPDFQLTLHNAAAVADLCSGMEGIPLALELAAARAQVMTPAQMVEQLKHRFDFLVTRRRDIEERHRTLNNAIDWSYRLLSPELQRLFARLSVFRGGWTVESAAAVCGVFGDAGEDAGDVLEAISQLMECSFILSEETSSGMRFRMLETLREFAVEAVDDYEALQNRYVQYFVLLAREASPHLTGADQKQWLERLDAEHDNIRATLAWLHGNDTSLGLKFAVSNWRFWYTRGYFRDGLRWLSSMLDEEAARPASSGGLAVRGKALNAAGVLSLQMSDYTGSRRFFEESLEVCRQLNDRSGMADVLNNLGAVAYEHGDFTRSRRLYEESLAIKRELGDRSAVAKVLGNLGSIAEQVSDYATARILLEESLAIGRELADQRVIAHSMQLLGTVYESQGDFVQAESLCRESLAIRQELGDRLNIAAGLDLLGNIAYRKREHEAALDLFRQSLVIRNELGDRKGLISSLEGFAMTVAMLGGPEQAAHAWGTSERLRELIGLPISAKSKSKYDQSVADARSKSSSPPSFDREWQVGRAMTMVQAIELVLGPDQPVDTQARMGRHAIMPTVP